MEEKKNIFKENWEKVDKTCIQCGQVTEKVKGITRQNIRRLLVPKFDGNEILITILLILVILLAISYKNETQACNDWKELMAEDKGLCYSQCDEMERTSSFQMGFGGGLVIGNKSFNQSLK